MSHRIKAEIQLRPDGRLSEVGIWVGSVDGTYEPTGQEILEAVSDLLLIYWDKNEMAPVNMQGYDS